jgi:Arc/MetJ family transcription regulator
MRPALAMCIFFAHMRTTIDIDEALMSRAMRATGLKTKRAVVEEGLRLLVKLKRLKRQKEILRLAGKVRWNVDLDESRLGPDSEDVKGSGSG